MVTVSINKLRLHRIVLGYLLLPIVLLPVLFALYYAQSHGCPWWSTPIDARNHPVHVALLALALFVLAVPFLVIYLRLLRLFLTPDELRFLRARSL